jgi:AT hook motif
MAGEEFMRGFVSGWTAASQALVGAFGTIGAEAGAGRASPSVALTAAADKPKVAGRRRGRPPKSASAIGDQPKRRRGRPRKAEGA